MDQSGKPFSWAIAGTGKIAADFASQVALIKGASLHAVFSRRREHAERFRSAFGMAAAYDSFEDMLADDAIDGVYIALPAALHHATCIKALRAKKPVLCEKPFAVSAAEAEEILAVSRQENTFCMEAMWLRFSPLVGRVRAMAANGELGRIRNIAVQVGYATPPARLQDADPGRGALLNFAVYGTSLVQMILGDPDSVHGDLIENETGLDEGCTLSLRYADALATVSASNTVTMNNEAVITGTKGRVRLGAPFYSPRYAEVMRLNEPSAGATAKHNPVKAVPKVDRIPFYGLVQGTFWNALLRRRAKLLMRKPGESGLKFEALEVMRCVREARIESETMSHADTLSVARILDQARGAQETTAPAPVSLEAI